MNGVPAAVMAVGNDARWERRLAASRGLVRLAAALTMVVRHAG